MSRDRDIHGGTARYVQVDIRDTTMNKFIVLIASAWLFVAVYRPTDAVAQAQLLEIAVEQQDNTVTVTAGGKFFARYVADNPTRPIVWPIVGPTGEEMTRGFPMRAAIENEKVDHPHHQSLWFAHGDVNGHDFWTTGHRSGSVKHRDFVRVTGGEKGVIVTNNDWLDEDKELVCSDTRTLSFFADDQNRYIDFDVTLQAIDKPAVFGDTKEGTFGMRVPGTVKVDQGLGGRIVNNKGDVDEETWGKKAAWVDYSGPVHNQTVGITIMNHPSSFRFPSYWHVRTYGLFAANAFGVHNFENNENLDGSYTLEPGQSITLCYRIVLHTGDENKGRIAEAFVDYAKIDKLALTESLARPEPKSLTEPSE